MPTLSPMVQNPGLLASLKKKEAEKKKRDLEAKLAAAIEVPRTTQSKPIDFGAYKSKPTLRSALTTPVLKAIKKAGTTPIPTIDDYKPRLAITKQAVGALKKTRDVLLPRPESDEEAIKMGFVPFKSPVSGETTYIDPLGAVGSMKRVGGPIKSGVQSLLKKARLKAGPKATQVVDIRIKDAAEKLRQAEKDLRRAQRQGPDELPSAQTAQEQALIDFHARAEEIDLPKSQYSRTISWAKQTSTEVEQGVQDLRPVFVKDAKAQAGPKATQVSAPKQSAQSESGLLTRLRQSLSPQKSTSLPPTLAETDTKSTAISRLKDAVSKAEAYSRPKLEKIYAAERAKRAGKVAGILSKSRGLKSQYAALGALKGELAPVKPSFSPIKLAGTDVDELVRTIHASNKLLPLEKVSTTNSFRGLLEGRIPTKNEIQMFSKVFPKDVVDTILQKRTLGEKAWDITQQVMNLPRAMSATGDLSAPLRQGVTMLHHPKTFTKNFGRMFKMAWKEGNYQNTMDEIANRPTYSKMRESGLSFTEIDAPNLTEQEERFLGNQLSEKIPIFGRLARASDRAYTGFLNKMRADVFDQLYRDATNLGVVDNPKLLHDFAKVINTSSGRGDLGVLNSAAPVLNGLLFSPRLAASRINMLFNPVYYTRLEPLARKEALKSVFTFLGAWSTVAGLAKLALGDKVDIGTDPRSADFGKIKSGNTRFDIAGGMQQYIKAAAQLFTGVYVSSTTGRELQLGPGFGKMSRADILSRFVQGKFSPVASFVNGLVKGENYQGEPFQVAPEIIDRMLPMLWQDAYEIMRDEGLLATTKAAPAVFGVGVQTYSDYIPSMGKTASGADKIEWRTSPSIGEDVVRKITGTELSDIPESEWPALRKERQQDILRGIQLEKTKAEVIADGKMRTVGETMVYLDDGVVKTKELRNALDAPKEWKKVEARNQIDADPQLSAKMKKLDTLLSSLGNSKSGKARRENLLDQLTPNQKAHYEAYKSKVSAEKSKHTAEFRDLLYPNPRDAIQYMKQLPQEEALRIFKLLTTAEKVQLAKGR